MYRLNCYTIVHMCCVCVYIYMFKKSAWTKKVDFSKKNKHIIEKNRFPQKQTLRKRIDRFFLSKITNCFDHCFVLFFVCALLLICFVIFGSLVWFFCLLWFCLFFVFIFMQKTLHSLCCLSFIIYIYIPISNAPNLTKQSLLKSRNCATPSSQPAPACVVTL